MSGAASGNLFSLEVRQNPYPFYRALRDNPPVFTDFARGSLLVSRYADVALVLNNPEVFSSRVMRMADATLLGADPPGHTKIRHILNRIFSTQRFESLSNDMEEVSERLMQRILQNGSCDFVRDFSIPMPLAIICRLIGVESDLQDNLKRWSSAVVVTASGMVDPAKAGEYRAVLSEFDDFLDDLILRRSDGADSDIVSTLLREVSAEETRSLVKLLLIAGTETTTNLLGNALCVLLYQPDELEKIRSHPSLLPNFIEEVIRYDCPVQFLQRRSVRPTEINGVNVPEGCLVFAIVGSANRDERQFEDPDRFDLRRQPIQHLGFGIGPHYCLGASLGRMEARLALTTILKTVHHLKATEPLESIPPVDSLQLRGPARLHVSVS